MVETQQLNDSTYSKSLAQRNTAAKEASLQPLVAFGGGCLCGAGPLQPGPSIPPDLLPEPRGLPSSVPRPLPLTRAPQSSPPEALRNDCALDRWHVV